MITRVSAFLNKIDKRLLPIHLGILVTFALIPMWGRLPGSPPPFSPHYFTGFAILWPLLGTIVAWLVTGLPGFKALRQDRLRVWWALLLLILALWMYVSPRWAFAADRSPGTAQTTSLQFMVVALFAVVVACARPSPRAIVLLLTISLLLHGTIAGLQVRQQQSIGLNRFGEFPLDPERSGVSVLNSGATRWLRPYGLLPHPNPLGGFFAVSTLAAIGWLVSDQRRVRWLGSGVFVFGLWVLWLTFSRAAWLGFAAGCFALYPLLRRTHLRRPKIRRQILMTLGIAGITGIAFFSIYRPLIISRTGADTAPTEIRSVVDRAIYTQIAYTAVLENPVRGVGSGNFPWYASFYLFYNTDYDLRGDNVHQVFLSAWAELGLVGYGLVMAVLLVGFEAVLRSYRSTTAMVDGMRLVLFGGAIAFTVIGLFDHYPWTMIQFQTAWWGLLALTITPS